MDNKQSGNVGNEGDILKHLALVKIIEEMQAEHAGPILYVDTHSFMAISTASDKNESVVTSTVESNDVPAYSALEKPYIDQGKYLCSPGIALSLGGDADTASFYFCEKDPATRAQLKTQIETEFPQHALRTTFGNIFNPEEFDQLVSSPDHACVMLIDPFTLKSDPSQAICPFDSLVRWGGPAACVIFNYGCPPDEYIMSIVPDDWSVVRHSNPPYFVTVLVSNHYELPCVRGRK